MLEVSVIDGENSQVIVGHHVLLYKEKLLIVNLIVEHKLCEKHKYISHSWESVEEKYHCTFPLLLHFSR